MSFRRIVAAALGVALVGCDDVTEPVRAGGADLKRPAFRPANVFQSGGESFGLLLTNVYGDAPTVALAQRSGAKWARIAAYRNYESAVESAEILTAAGIQVFVTLAWDQCNLETHECPALPTDAEWRAWVDTVVTAIGSNAAHYGVLNEANAANGFYDISAAKFDSLVKGASDVVRATHGKQLGIPDVIDDVGGARAWLSARLTANAGYYDFITVHKYGPNSGSWAAGYTGLLELADTAAAWSKDLWATEAGMASWSDATQMPRIAALIDAMGGHARWKKTFMSFQGDSAPSWVHTGLVMTNASPYRVRSSFYKYMELACLYSRCDPVARWHATYNGGHFYSLDLDEVDGQPGNWLEDTDGAFYTMPTNYPGNFVQLHQCYSFNAHILTLQTNCESIGGASYDRALGYIAPSNDSLPGMRRLARYYRASDTDYLTVSCPSEAEVAVEEGYSLQTTLGFVWSTWCTPSAPTILGPSSVLPSEWCGWQANGSASNYVWKADGSVEGSNSQYFTRSSSSSFWLKAILRDGLYAPALASLYVTVSGGAESCFI